MYPDGVKHFRRDEWRHDPDRVAPELVRAMDVVRDLAGVPIHINQAWDPSGHVDGSGHGLDPALAVDFFFRGLTFLDQLSALNVGPFTGIGFYPDWNTPGWHADIKPRSKRAFWTRRNGAYIYYASAMELAEAMGWTVTPRIEPVVSGDDGAIYLPAIQAAAVKHELPQDLVRAMALQESTFKPYRNRFEQGFYDSYIKGKKLDFVPPYCLRITESLGRATSWGLLQVMGTTARQYGFRGWFPELCIPEVGLDWGCRYLADLRRQFGREGWPNVVRAYNGGPGGRHNLKNCYPDEVLEKLGGRWPDA